MQLLEVNNFLSFLGLVWERITIFQWIFYLLNLLCMRLIFHFYGDDIIVIFIISSLTLRYSLSFISISNRKYFKKIAKFAKFYSVFLSRNIIVAPFFSYILFIAYSKFNVNYFLNLKHLKRQIQFFSYSSLFPLTVYFIP